MDPTCGLVDKFRDLVLNLIWEQFLYLVCYGQNIEELNEQLEKLTLERTSIQNQIDEARNNGEQIEEKVLRWLSKVDEISEQVEQLLKEGQAKRECSLTSCPFPWLRYNLSKRAKAMAKQVADIFENAKFGRFSYRLPPQSMPELTNGESNEWIDSRVAIMNQIMEALRNSSINMIGLCGLGGVGKTTIAKEIANNQKLFKKAIMAIVSSKLNIKDIQDQIAEALGMQLNEKTKKGRASRLRERLEKEKNMLLILDDLWEELNLRDVGIPIADVENYNKNNECCKILLTSRNEAVLSHRMKCQKLIKVDILLDNEALKLFERINGSISPELKSIADDIVQKCGGLPLAIATAAKALQEKDVDGWEDYLVRWKTHLRRNTTGIREVDASLKLSYDSLSRENKNIFLLSAMLSHDPSAVDLLMYSVGLDFLQDIENMEEAHIGISNIVRKLKSLNLFLDSFSRHRFTIHDAYRDVALSIASDKLSIASDKLSAFIVKHKMLKEWPDENRLEGYKGIYLEEADISIELPEELNAPGLQFFLLHSTRRDLTIPDTFFKSSKDLKLLAFTNLHFSLLPSLTFLQKLKALCLHSCVLEDIAGVRSLKKLKVLSLAYSKFERLPVELAELTCLQMLNLSHCIKLQMIPEKLLSSFKKLEVLYMENSFNQWKEEATCEANENASLDELKDLPISSLDICIPTFSMLPENLFLHMNLKRYRILIGKHWQWWQCNHENSKILRLELERGIHLKSGFQKLLEGVGDLHLYGSNGLDNILFSDAGRGFPYLRHLQIENNDDIKCIVLNSTGHETSFPVLESLVLQDLKELEKLCEGTNTIAFHQLRTLKMKNLPALTADPCLKDGATNNVSNKMFKSLFNEVSLPKLEILELRNLNIEQLSYNSLSNLKTLIVEGCGFVKLLPLNALKSLNNLEELEIKDCVMLKMVFDFEDLNAYKETESSSVVVPLKKLKLWGLPKLKNVLSSHYQGNVSFPSLRSVEFANAAFECPRLTSLELNDLPKLRNLYPLECPNLQWLSIVNCELFEMFRKEVSYSLEIQEEEGITLNSNYPLLSRHQVIHDLEELILVGEQAEMIVSGLFPMYRFPKVKMLHLSFHHTTISYKSLRKSFPNLEKLKLCGEFEVAPETDDVAAAFLNLDLEFNCNMRSLSPSLVSSQNLTHLQVTYCLRLTTLMTSSTAQCLVHLTCLSIDTCKEMEEIITKQKGENDEDKEIIFSKLKVLEFRNLPRLKRFCGYNYTFRFPLLEQITMRGCPKFKLFSPGNVDTPSLKSVQLSENASGTCHEIWDTNLKETFYQQLFVTSREVVLDKYNASMIRNDWFPQVEILGIEGLVDDELVTLLERFPQAVLPKLEILELYNLLNNSISLIWEEQLLHNSFNNLKTLIVKSCGSLKSVPIHVLKSLNKLEKLKVCQCNMLEMVISFEDWNDSKETKSSLVVVPLNLAHLEVEFCQGLTTLMTSSAARSLVHLAYLSISFCGQIKEIITKQEGEDEEDMEIVFDKLEILKLFGLARLKRFCGHNYTFSFSLLECLTIRNCPQLTMFCPGATHAPLLKRIQVGNLYGHHRDIWMTDLNDTIQHGFNIKEVISTTESMALNAENITMINDVFPKVVDLYVGSFTDEGVTFPYSSLERFPKLRCLYVEHCSFEEIFPSHDHVTDDFMEEIPPFNLLFIAHLDQLKSIWKDDSQLLHQNLTSLNVESCCNLVKLAPSSASFQCLVEINVFGCHQLIHLVTSSTAKSLVSLQWLEINDCKNMEAVVMNESNEDVEVAITFDKLQKIKLTDMPGLKMFSSQSHNFKFPKLKKLKITGCPEMNMFCPGGLKAPKLSKVKIEEHDMAWKDDDDLNKKIQILSSAKDNIVKV